MRYRTNSTNLDDLINGNVESRELCGFIKFIFTIKLFFKNVEMDTIR